MVRSVVFKTPGKLDLRSIMTFGLNAKPNTGHPIGFFGTGLKYALAVLTRYKFPVTMYIDGQKWSIDTEDSIFRDKTVTEVFLTRHRKLMVPVHKKLPFTTELGKTWELWQAFRELYSNTLDENGIALVYQDGNENHFVADLEGKGCTLIRVEGEAFVQEYFDRDKTFLPEGMTQREGTQDVQIFDRPSAHVYYRGIRVMDLKDDERSQLTYNILRPIELTEDRTAKSKWDVQYYIQQAVSSLTDKEQIKKVITAPDRSFEGTMNYYNAPSKEFLETASEAIEDKSLKVLSHAKTVVDQYQPKKVKAHDNSDWFEPLIQAINNDSAGDDALDIIYQHREELIEILKAAQTTWRTKKDEEAKEAEHTAVGGTIGTAVHTEIYETNADAKADDDIPF